MFFMKVVREDNIETFPFENSFQIVKTNNQLIWSIDLKPFVPSLVDERGGTIAVWIKSASHSAIINFIPPDWNLTVDGITFTGENRLNYKIAGKFIELEYLDYKFSCQF